MHELSSAGEGVWVSGTELWVMGWQYCRTSALSENGISGCIIRSKEGRREVVGNDLKIYLFCEYSWCPYYVLVLHWALGTEINHMQSLSSDHYVLSTYYVQAGATDTIPFHSQGFRR